MNQDKLWDAYQNDLELQDMGCRDGGRVHHIATFIPSDKKVLDIGVGRGTLISILTEKDCQVFCLDPSETSIHTLQADLGLGDRARVGYAQNIPFEDHSFDYVVMTEVLEHLSDEVLIETIREVRRVLVPGGMFVGSVPADENLIDSLVICPDCGKRFHRWGHMQSFSQQRLQGILVERFEQVKVLRVNFSDLRELNWKGKIVAVAKRMQAMLDKKGSSQNFVFQAKKLESPAP